MDFILIPIYFGKNFRPTDSDKNFKASELDNAVTSLCASSFFEELRPFGCSSVSAQVGEYIILDEIPASWANTPSVTGFTDGELQSLIQNALNTGTIPGPEAFPGKKAIYCGIVRQGQKHANDQVANGRNDNRFNWTKPGTLTSTEIVWAWAYQGDNLDDSTLIYFHEAVEGMANYLGFGERCDPCHYAKLTTNVAGVNIEPYLDSLGRCIAPRQFSRRMGTPVCMAWKAVDNSAIYWSTLSTRPDDRGVPHSHWDKPVQVSQVGTSHSPALAWHEGELWMAWKGMDDDQSIYWSVYANGGWRAQKSLEFAGTSSHPALASFNGELYLVWKGADDDTHIWWSKYRGYDKWGGQQVIDGQATSRGVSLLAGQNLYMAWRGAEDDQTIWFSTYNAYSPGWSAQQPLEGKTTDTPSMALLTKPSERPDRILLTWKGAGDDTQIWQSIGEKGVWMPQSLAPGAATGQGPAVVGDGNDALWRVWRGAEGDDQIWWAVAEYEGKWSPQQTVDSSMDLAAGTARTSVQPALAVVN